MANQYISSFIIINKNLFHSVWNKVNVILIKWVTVDIFNDVLGENWGMELMF